MFLGSSLGNFTPDSACKFLRNLPLRPGSNDKLLLGLDHDNDKALVERAYNDSLGITRDFILNGLKVAGRILGNENAFDLTAGHWEYVNFYNQFKSMLPFFSLCNLININTILGRHEAHYRSACDQTIEFPSTDGGEALSVHFEKNELVHVEYSHKASSRPSLLY
jgi:uncharacterized SAM-dependent methyltransferase